MTRYLLPVTCMIRLTSQDVMLSVFLLLCAVPVHHSSAQTRRKRFGFSWISVWLCHCYRWMLLVLCVYWQQCSRFSFVTFGHVSIKQSHIWKWLAQQWPCMPTKATEQFCITSNGMWWTFRVWAFFVCVCNFFCPVPPPQINLVLLTYFPDVTCVIVLFVI